LLSLILVDAPVSLAALSFPCKGMLLNGMNLCIKIRGMLNDMV